MAIAMVRLIIDHEDVLETGCVAQNARNHLSGRFNHLRAALARRTDQHRLCAGGEFQRGLQLKGMVVGDDDAGRLDERQHILRDEIAMLIVGLVIIRQQNAQAVFDRNTWRRDEKPVRELGADAMPCGIDRLPGNDHRHHGGLARACRQLQCNAIEILVRRVIGERNLLQELLAAHRGICDLGEPNEGFDRFDLTEERTDVRKVVLIAPPFEKPCRLGRHAPFL